MIAVVFNWMYILAASFLCGYAFARFAERLFAYRIENMTGVIFSGLVIATVYAQLASLIGGVGIIANIALILACAVILYVWRKEITYVICEKIRAKSAAYKITVAILMSIWCYCTSRGYMHYDSDLYHAQSIRWIEEYGVVAGLGNIHLRFAYNSSFFALSALYSMSDIAGASLHTVNGFIALLLSVEVIEIFFRFHAQLRTAEKSRANSFFCSISDKARLSDFARLGAFYYLTLIYRDIVSPASDYCVMCVIFYIIIRWLSYIEEDRQDVAPYALLCVACAYAITLKLAAGAILLLVAKPAITLLKEKRYREIAAYIFMGTAVILPWIARNALISGYLIYPFPAIDVIYADWKIPKAKALIDAAEIKTWARGLENAALVNLPVSGWFAQWFNALPTLGKLFILLDILCVAIFAILLITYAIKIIRGKNAQGMADKLLVIATVASSYLFWQLSAPSLRYGYAHVLLLIFLTAGYICIGLCRLGANAKSNRRLLAYGISCSRMIFMLALFLAVAKTPSLAKYIASTADKEFYVNQQDYGAYELDSFEVKGVTFYYPKSGDRTGYAYFPSIPTKVGIEFRGGGIEDGFR